MVDIAPSSGFDDAWGWSVGGGLDLNGDPVMVSWELSGLWSQHDDLSGGVHYEGDLDVLRFTTGLRLSTRLTRAPLGAYVRGGGLWRQEESYGASAAGDEWGSYWGGGIEWWCAPNVTLGPSVTWMRGADSGREDVYVALTARIY